MNMTFFDGALLAAQALLGLGMLFALYRLLRGPRAQDRVLALDVLYVNAMLLVLTFGMRHGTALYFEAALVIGMLGFVSTAAAAKFLLRGEVIE
jgi:multicomponent K+:H+ antiporter subunit F